MLPEGTGPFVVGCATCERTLMVVNRIGDAEVVLLARHLRRCAPAEPLAQTPTLEEVLRRIRVTSVAASADGRRGGKC
jgi:hypothetical protein